MHCELIFMWCKVRIQFHYFAYVSTLFVERTVLSSLNSLSILVKNHLIIYARVYFWTFYSIPLVMSVLLPILHCFEYYSFAVICQIRKCEFSNFVLQHCFGYPESLESLYVIQIYFFISAENVIGILIKITLHLYYIYWFLWVILPF